VMFDSWMFVVRNTNNNTNNNVLLPGVAAYGGYVYVIFARCGNIICDVLRLRQCAHVEI